MEIGGSYYGAFYPWQSNQWLKSYIIIDFRPSTMEFSTRHVVCFTLQFKLAVASSNQIKPARSSCSARDLKGNSMAYRITSALDFNKRGCVKQI